MCVLLYIGVHYVCVCVCHAMATICTFVIAHTTFHHSFVSLLLLEYNLHVSNLIESTREREGRYN